MARIWNKHRGNTPLKPKVFVGMSGGVDSSVAAYLLKKQGYDVTGVFMRSYNVDGCAERDAEDARRVAEHIGIPFYVFDFEKEYKESVVDYMVEAYREGSTPNPDVMCNKEIKFGLFLKRALKMGVDSIATGHYVRLAPRSLGLFEAKDKNKDQSYFLWTLTPEQLKHCVFPIGGYTKPQVREIARKAGLPTAEKKDSQGICFLGQVDLMDFLKQYLPEKPGDIITTDGKVVGQHEGVYFYTIGQRHLGVNLKVKSPDHKPYYVAAKDLAKNELIVAEGGNNQALFSAGVELRKVNLLRATSYTFQVRARVRYRQPLFDATLCVEDNGKATLEFREPVKFVALGQSAVIYSPKGEMWGGGIISKSYPPI